VRKKKGWRETSGFVPKGQSQGKKWIERMTKRVEKLEGPDDDDGDVLDEELLVALDGELFLDLLGEDDHAAQ
jgi:hypothetical protein